MSKKVSKRQVAAALRRARNLIKQGFTKQQFSGKDFSRWDTKTGAFTETFCTIGAINRVDGPAEAGAKKAIYRAVTELFYPNSKRGITRDEQIFRFNDRKKTTQADVVRAFDRAIEIVLQPDEEPAAQ